jgi:hypothetical protein
MSSRSLPVTRAFALLAALVGALYMVQGPLQRLSLPRRLKGVLRKRSTTCQAYFQRPVNHVSVASVYTTSLPGDVFVPVAGGSTTQRSGITTTSSSAGAAASASPTSNIARWNWTSPDQISFGVNVGNWLLYAARRTLPSVPH